MLENFSVQNFKNFPQKITWDLTDIRSYAFNTFAVKDGVLKNGIIYGKNGSGKTNFGLAVFDIVSHLGSTFRGFGHDNYAYAGRPDEPVRFSYGFRFGRQHLLYAYAKNRAGQLLAERLVVDGKEIFRLADGVCTIDPSSFQVDQRTLHALAHNVNHVSVINFLLGSFPVTEDHYLAKLQHFVDSMLWFRCLEDRRFIGLEHAPEDMQVFIIQHHLVGDFQKFLSEVSGQEYQFVEPKEGDRDLFCQVEGRAMPFFVTASTGTHALVLLYYWMQKMRQASFVFIDEFDAFYHYELSFLVCKKLFGFDCQVFMTSHNLSIMTNDLLRPDCYFLLSHNNLVSFSNATQKDLRQGHNLERLYRGGVFGT